MNLKHVLLAAALTAATAAGAGNLRADFDMSHDLWWNAPEIPQVGIAFTDSVTGGYDGAVRIYFTTDLAPHTIVADTTLTLAAVGRQPANVTISLPGIAPGFYLCHVTDGSGTEIASKWIGFEPTNVVSLPDAPDDFDEFWTRAKAELASIPAEYTLTPRPDLSGARRDVFDCTFRSWGGDTIDARIAVPKAPGKYPALVYYNGYNAKPWDLDPDGNPDWIEMMTSVRGQFFSNPRNTYGDFIQYHLDDPETYYYKGAYLDAVRAIDIIGQLPQTDTTRIYAEGGSQGGALTLAAAALSDGRLKAIAPYIPFLSDFPHYFGIVDWPASAISEARTRLGLSEREALDNLRYFDIKNFARRITCPVLMGIGLQDPTCPPHTNLSSYNLITSPKQLLIYPTCGHTVDYADWNPRRSAFFELWR